MSTPFAPQLAQGKNGTVHINAALAAAATRQKFTVAGLAALTPVVSYDGAIVFCSNGAAGQPCLAYCDGTVWHQIALGAAVSAS